MKKHINQIVYDVSTQNDPPENLKEHIQWLDEILHSIPKEFRDSASVEIGSGSQYEDPVLEYAIQYTRHETDEEEKQRTNRESSRLRRVRNQEIEMMEKLIVKYSTKEE